MSTPTIARGDTGAGVRDVQQRLARLLALTIPLDGVFGPTTERAVRSFQRERGLLADGIVGPETWRTLTEAGYRLGDRLIWHGSPMLRGDDVRELQHRLNQLGFNAGPEDGIFGPLGHAALEEFQRNVGLPTDGVAGPRTVAALTRLRRDHQSEGVGIRAREREWLRQVAARGFNAARVVVDPAHGPDDPGALGSRGVPEHRITWEIARRLAARVAAAGAEAVLARGPATTPSASQRAQLANRLGADLVVGLALASHPTPAASGPSSFYFGAPNFTSEAGRQLAEELQHALVRVSDGPDGRSHPVTWTLLRETRMPAVVCEPGFLTNPHDEGWLLDPGGQEAVADALATALATMFARLGR